MIPLLLALAHAAEAPPAAPAPAAPTSPTVKVSALLFPRYTLDLAPGLANEFALDRTYLRAEARLDEHWGARITLDSKRTEPVEVTLADGTTTEVALDQRYSVFVKHAWLEWRPNAQLTVRGGIIDTPLVTFVGSQRNLRWIHKTFVDDVDLASSADVGVNVGGKHGGGLVSWAAGVYNGETYKSPETGSGKSVQGRFTVDPLARGGGERSLQLTAFGDANVQDDGVPTVFVAVGDAMLRVPWLRLGAQVATRAQGGVTGLGESFVVAPELPEVGYLFVRVDHWTADLAAPDADQLTVIAGPAHDFTEKLCLGVFYLRTAEAGATPEQSVSLQAEVGF